MTPKRKAQEKRKSTL